MALAEAGRTHSRLSSDRFLNEELCLGLPLKYVCSDKKFTKNFQYFTFHLETDVQRSVSNKSQYLLRIQGPTIVCESF